jgi:alpha-galactosidase
MTPDSKGIQKVIKRTNCAKWVLSVWALLLGVSMSASAQADLTGYWKYSVPNGGVNFLELKQSGEDIFVNLRGGMLPKPCGSLHGDKLHLEVPSPFGPPNARRFVVYDAVVKGDKFAASKKQPDEEPNSGYLERVSREEAFPSRLPLPELRALPDNGLARTPPMGWNSWNTFHDKFDDATVRQMADAMVSSGMRDAGYTYIVVDEGWSSYRDKDGKITGNARFPDMKALADYVHSKGLKIGIYSSPGPQVCGGYQGSYGHEEQDAKTFAEWGYDYLKYDWCSAFGIYQPTPADVEGAYQKMGEALARTGRPIVYSLCEYGLGDVWSWGAKAGGNLWRTTFDIADNWDSMERIGFAQLDIAQYPRPGHWNDPDMLEVGNGGMTVDEYRTHMSLWAMLRAPLIAGNDLRQMSDETKSILMNAEVVAIDQDPAAMPLQILSVDGKSEVLVRPLEGNAVTVGLFNRGDLPAQISFRWDSLHLGANLGGKTMSARDLWNHSAVQTNGDSYTATVPKHGVVLLKVEAQPFRFR